MKVLGYDCKVQKDKKNRYYFSALLMVDPEYNMNTYVNLFMSSCNLHLN